MRALSGLFGYVGTTLVSETSSDNYRPDHRAVPHSLLPICGYPGSNRCSYLCWVYCRDDRLEVDKRHSRACKCIPFVCHCCLPSRDKRRCDAPQAWPLPNTINMSMGRHACGLEVVMAIERIAPSGNSGGVTQGENPWLS